MGKLIKDTETPKYKVVHTITYNKKTYYPGDVVELPEKNAKNAGNSVVLIPDTIIQEQPDEKSKN